MSSQHSSTDPHEKWPRNNHHDTDSIAETVSSVDTQDDQDALGRALTAHASRISHMSLSERVTTIPTNATSDPNFEVDWDSEDDPVNPKNWSMGYTAMGILFLSWNTLIVYVENRPKTDPWFL